MALQLSVLMDIKNGIYTENAIGRTALRLNMPMDQKNGI